MKLAFTYNVLVEMTRGEIEAYIKATDLALDLSAADLDHYDKLGKKYGWSLAAIKFPRGVHLWNLRELNRDLKKIWEELPF